MKRIKNPLAVLAIIAAVTAAFAFTPAPKKINAGKAFTSVYELASGGTKTTRTDWVLSSPDPDCTTLHTEMPCRIIADPSGSNPSVASFNDILTNSSNFTVAYPAKVTYEVPE